MEKKLKRKIFHEKHAIWKWQWWAKVWEDTKKIAINKTKFSLMASFHKFLHIHVVHSTSATTARMMTLSDKDKNGKLFQWSWEYKDKLHLFCFFFPLPSFLWKYARNDSYWRKFAQKIFATVFVWCYLWLPTLFIISFLIPKAA